MKLRNRINLFTAVMFLVLLILINSVIYYAFSSMMLNSELEKTTAEAEQALEGINQAGTEIPMNQLLRAYLPISGMLQIVREDGSQGTTVAAPGQQGLRDQPVTFFQREKRKIVHYNGIPHAFVSIPIILTGGEVAALQLTENLKATSDMLAILRLVLIAVTVLATIPVMISSRLLSNFISRPIISMINTMREIRASGQFKRIPLPKESKDELYQMGETFNNMIDLLEVNYEKQGQFISNASHELKTPLTIIESYASLLKRRGSKAPDLFDESIEAIHSEAIRMKDLTGQLLLLAKQDEQWKVELEDLNLTDVVEEMVRSFQNAYKREINLEIEDEVIIRADHQKFRQLFYIFIDNARKYSEDSIEVRVRKNHQKAVVEIIDRGIGIPEADLDKIFDRFFRADKARTRRTGGFGLGLSLAKEMADVMGIELRIDSIEGHGTRAQILLTIAVSH